MHHVYAFIINNDIAWIKYAMAPVYGFCALWLWRSIGYQRELMWWVLLGTQTTILIASHSLVDFRHFIIPTLILRSGVAPVHGYSPMIPLLAHVIISAALDGAFLWMFLKKSFVMADGTIGRYVF